jgi:hypothetical protein
MTLALLLAAFLQSEGFPLHEEARWTYHTGGREGLILEAIAPRQIGSVVASGLRVRGASFFWTSHDLYVSGGEGLIVRATTFGEKLWIAKKPYALLPAALKEGATWIGDNGEGFAYAASILRREAVKVPAGAFDAWVVEYVLTDHLGTECDLRAWYAPGTGFVKIEKWRQSTRAVKKDIAPVVHELAKYERERAATAAAAPLTDDQRKQADKHVAELGDESIEARARAADALFALGRGVVAHLQERIRAGGLDAEVRGRIIDVIARFATVEVLARATREKGKAGEPLPIEFRLRNPSPTPIHVIGSLDASDVGWRFPKYQIVINDEKGTLVATERGMR